MTKLLVVLLAILFVIHGVALGQSHTTIVVALDLTRSEDVRGPDGTTEFQKNVQAVTKRLEAVPADSHVTILGITDHSFGQPDILLSATIPADAGYFGERLTAARHELVRVWTARSRNMEPRFQQTDITGALELASQIFKREPAARKVLAIYSDMRQNTAELEIESETSLAGFERLKRSRDLPQIDLREVEVSALGVDGAGRTMAYWRSLRDFWTDFFRTTDATLLCYSVLRSPDE